MNRLIYVLEKAGFEITRRNQWGMLIAENVRPSRTLVVTKYRDADGNSYWFKIPPRIDLN